MATLNASAPLPVILDALARAGWAELDGRSAQGVRSVLRGLCALLPHRSATGLVTANQVADAAGLKSRQTRDNLQVLETAGIITWTRGGIRDGRPTPGAITVHKRRLVDLVRRARRDMPARLRARATETAQRLETTLRARTLRNRAAAQGWRRSNTAPGRSQPALPHAAFTATPSPSGEVTGAPQGGPRGTAPALNSTGLATTPTTINNRPAVGSRRAQLRRAMALTGTGTRPC